jgi:hypothetical protein
MNEKNSKLTISVEMDNPCYRCNQTCSECPYSDSSIDYAAIADEAKAFRLELELDLRQRNSIKISI